MSWLDDMEAADPAYPGPDADPWAAPGYLPDTARGRPAEMGTAIGECARQQNPRAPQPGPDGPPAGGPADDPLAGTGHLPGPASRHGAGEAERAAPGYREPLPGLAVHVNRDAAARPARQQQTGRTFTLAEAYQVAEDAVGLFLEYRDVHGRSEADARIEALSEVAQGLHAWGDAGEALNPHRSAGPDWQALRAAEVQARDAGLRVTAPWLDGHGSPEYQAHAAAWGSGRGSGPTAWRWAKRWG